MDSNKHMAILLDMTHPDYLQANRDIARLHTGQTSIESSPNIKKSRDDAEMLIRTRDIPQDWLEARSWYPGVVLAGPFDLDSQVLDNGQYVKPYERWCNEVWLESARMTFASSAERRTYWQSRLPE